MRKLQTSEETAIILAVMMSRKQATRARISDRTIRLISGRKRLEASFRLSLNDDLAQFGFIMVGLDSGGQAVVKIAALEAAKPITAAKVLDTKELQALKRGSLQIEPFRRELGDNGDEDEGRE